jgi:uncharacterized membrane protein
MRRTLHLHNFNQHLLFTVTIIMNLKSLLKDVLLYFLLSAGTLLMLRTILLYTSFKTDVAFLAQKQDYLSNKVWLAAFYTHVFTSIFTLVAGFTQFSKDILKRNSKTHKLVGKLYVLVVLCINVPAGFIMAIYANGLWPSKLAFMLLDILWAWFTYKAWIEAKHKNFKLHKQFMIRSYALTLAALTLRTWKLLLSNMIVIDPLTLYMIDAWLGFVPNLLLAEILIRRKIV